MVNFCVYPPSKPGSHDTLAEVSAAETDSRGTAWGLVPDRDRGEPQRGGRRHRGKRDQRRRRKMRERGEERRERWERGNDGRKPV